MKKILFCFLLFVLFLSSVPGEAAAPVITEHPLQYPAAHRGTTLVFRVTATGSEPLTYQWQGKRRYDAPWDDISGTNSAEYSYTIPMPSNMSNPDFYENNYWVQVCVVVSNSYGSVTSDITLVSLLYPTPPQPTTAPTEITQPPTATPTGITQPTANPTYPTDPTDNAGNSGSGGSGCNSVIASGLFMLIVYQAFRRRSYE